MRDQSGAMFTADEVERSTLDKNEGFARAVKALRNSGAENALNAVENWYVTNDSVNWDAVFAEVDGKPSVVFAAATLQNRGAMILATLHEVGHAAEEVHAAIDCRTCGECCRVTEVEITERDIDEVAREIRVALLEADVNVVVVKAFIARIKEQALGADLSKSLTPAQQIIKIVHDELARTLGGPVHALVVGDDAGADQVPAERHHVALGGAGAPSVADKDDRTPRCLAAPERERHHQHRQTHGPGQSVAPIAGRLGPISQQQVAAHLQGPQRGARCLQQQGISCEVVDLRTVRPLDTEAVLKSVRKTHRAVVVEEAWHIASVGGTIVDVIQREAFDDLDAPVIRLNSKDVPMPYNKYLESLYAPGVEDVVRAVKKVTYTE